MYRILGCFGLFFLFICKAGAAPHIEFSSSEQKFSLKEHTEYLRDPSTTLTVDEFRQIVRDEAQRMRPFENAGPSLHLGYTNDVVWLHTRVINAQERSQRVVFDIDYPLLNQVQMYQFEGDTLIARQLGGDIYPKDRSYYKSRSISLPADLEAGAHYDFYFRVRTPGLISLPVTVYGEPSFFEKQHLSSLVLYSIFGIYLGFCLYHLMIFVDNRQLTYLAFSLATLGRLAYDLYASGEGQHFTPHAIYWNNLAFAYLSSFAAAAGLWFHAEFLNLRENSRLAYYGIMAYAFAFVAGAQYGYFVDYYFFLVMGLFQMALPIVLSLSALRWMLKGYRPAKIYFFGSLLTMISLFISNISMLGLLPTVPNLAIYSALGYTLSFVVFALSISARIKDLARQQQEAVYDAETARARDNAKSEFLAHMSHEIRTPLNGVLGMLQLLSASKLNREQKDCVRIIDSSGKTLLNIVNDILDYSRIEAGRLSIEKIPFNLRETCAELHNLFSKTEKRSVSLNLDIDPALPPWVIGDPARVRQVLVNLLGNAYKFTDEGEITLRIEHLQAERFRLSVTDTGIGIGHKQRERLFASFEQTRDDIHRQYGGTGLGLAICKQLAELMGGAIGVESEASVGSTFWVELPLPSVKDDTVESPEMEEQVSFVPANASLRLLVAEDNRVNQLVVEKMISKLGHYCTVVADGCEAVKEVQERHENYDLVLMDCDMPVKDGYQAAMEIREFEQTRQLRRIPIIALTAHAVEALRQKSLEFGMDDHLSKPLVMEALQEVLDRHCALEAAL
ncbi:ATP-binding protein [Gilvimarinus sp. F26214L]|uniref:ATP-binding protein n=1 Tax=Gilvimarinus sp. DZF01 TaxID=3461371 RepID=UPI0040459AA2